MVKGLAPIDISLKKTYKCPIGICDKMLKSLGKCKLKITMRNYLISVTRTMIKKDKRLKKKKK